jgi:hypothetical protein
MTEKKFDNKLQKKQHIYAHLYLYQSLKTKVAKSLFMQNDNINHQ